MRIQTRNWLLGIAGLLALLATAPATTAQARSYWQASYYGNVGLTGTPAATRYEETINYDWGTAAPLPAVPADYFSVRWVKTVRLTAATYHVSVQADDGVRVYVDGELIIDDFVTHALRSSSADIILNSGEHEITVEYFEWTERAAIRFTMERTEQPVQPITVGQGMPDTATVTGVRWLLNVYERPGNTGSQIVGRVANGEEVIMLARRSASGRYVQIELSNGASGWIHRDFLESAADMGAYNVFATETDGPWGALPYRNLYAVVDAISELRAYAQPGDLLSGEVGVYRLGEVVKLTGFQSDSGMYVQTDLPNGQRGWVFGGFLDGQVNLYSLAVYNP